VTSIELHACCARRRITHHYAQGMVEKIQIAKTIRYVLLQKKHFDRNSYLYRKCPWDRTQQKLADGNSANVQNRERARPKLLSRSVPPFSRSQGTAVNRRLLGCVRATRPAESASGSSCKLKAEIPGMIQFRAGIMRQCEKLRSR
jgi:hypothetical protein